MLRSWTTPEQIFFARFGKAGEPGTSQSKLRLGTLEPQSRVNSAPRPTSFHKEECKSVENLLLDVECLIRSAIRMLLYRLSLKAQH